MVLPQLWHCQHHPVRRHRLHFRQLLLVICRISPEQPSSVPGRAGPDGFSCSGDSLRPAALCTFEERRPLAAHNSPFCLWRLDRVRQERPRPPVIASKLCKLWPPLHLASARGIPMHLRPSLCLRAEICLSIFTFAPNKALLAYLRRSSCAHAYSSTDPPVPKSVHVSVKLYSPSCSSPLTGPISTLLSCHLSALPSVLSVLPLLPSVSIALLPFRPPSVSTALLAVLRLSDPPHYYRSFPSESP
jgi:hypothetical protein